MEKSKGLEPRIGGNTPSNTDSYSGTLPTGRKHGSDPAAKMPSLLKPTFFASLPIMGSSSGSTEQQRKLEDPDSQQLDANPDLVADSVYVKARNTMEVRAR